MKPITFGVERPSSVDEVLELLADDSRERRVIAGGQSLIPLMNFRMSAPEVLVDLGGVQDLRGTREADGALHVGAMTTMTQTRRSALVQERVPLLPSALELVAHEPIRNRATIGGSLAHADPAAELPAVAVLLEAELVLRSTKGTRTVSAEDFFLGPYMTGINSGEILSDVVIPVRPGAHEGIEEVSRRKGDFALAGAASRVTTSASGELEDARVVVFAAAMTPTVFADVPASVLGGPLDDAAITSIAEACAADMPVVADLHGSEPYRRHLVRVCVARSLRRTLDNA